MEDAIRAVQRGTDRTAAELAVPRLGKELDQLSSLRHQSLAAEKAKMQSARSGRRSLTLLTFVVVFFGGLMLIGFTSEHSKLLGVFSIVWCIAIFAIPTFVFKTIKLPKDNSRKIASDIDARAAKVEEHLRANRKILDELPV
ncbi:hypothetical protein G7047_18035 [Diaphorobacter sp. HDW4A]|uniref:hypothetical protein n=1 Tax=Diaphorobacter sp. HDW4A TaxID=2714924 RepID=UPI00140B92C5|nr:hypothetical protein [Diaphorobacter sp. HDW4A]QIL81600.1 hypothetical protein G7047_18035 [Diaphorobacter sp. HDW4A]